MKTPVSIIVVPTGNCKERTFRKSDGSLGENHRKVQIKDCLRVVRCLAINGGFVYKMNDLLSFAIQFPFKKLSLGLVIL